MWKLLDPYHGNKLIGLFSSQELLDRYKRIETMEETNDSTGRLCIECGLDWAVGGEEPQCQKCLDEE